MLLAAITHFADKLRFVALGLWSLVGCLFCLGRPRSPLRAFRCALPFGVSCSAPADAAACCLPSGALHTHPNDRIGTTGSKALPHGAKFVRVVCVQLCVCWCRRASGRSDCNIFVLTPAQSVIAVGRLRLLPSDAVVLGPFTNHVDQIAFQSNVRGDLCRRMDAAAQPPLRSS